MFKPDHALCLCLLLVAVSCVAANEYSCTPGQTKGCQTLYSLSERDIRYVIVDDGFVFFFAGATAPLRQKGVVSEVLRCRQEQPDSCQTLVGNLTTTAAGGIAVLRPGELVITSGDVMLACGMRSGICKQMATPGNNEFYTGRNALIVANDAVYAGEPIEGKHVMSDSVPCIGTTIPCWLVLKQLCVAGTVTQSRCIYTQVCPRWNRMLFTLIFYLPICNTHQHRHRRS
jgi:hypothetical protein